MTLYRFRTYGESSRKGEDIQVVHEMIANGRIAFPSPATFNDPFEFRPDMVPLHSDPAAQGGALREASIRAALHRGLSMEAALREVNNPLSPHLKASEFRHQLEDLLARNVRVCSFSSTRDHPLLWSHYAASHAGVCVHFDRQVLPFALALQVEYTDDYPTIPFPREVGKEFEQIQRTMLTKASFWKYESEERLIRYTGLAGNSGELFGDLGVEWRGNVALAPSRAVIGISIGARMPGQHQDALMQFVGKIERPFEVWRTHLNPRRYQLDFERVR